MAFGTMMWSILEKDYNNINNRCNWTVSDIADIFSIMPINDLYARNDET